MNKIINVALKATFPNVDTNRLYALIESTPNPVVATEKLLGIFEMPCVNKGTYSKNDREYNFVSYNEWTDEVTYSYTYEDTSCYYFPKGTTKEEAMASGDRITSSSGLKDYEYYHLKNGKTATSTSTTSREQWNKDVEKYS